MGRVELLVEGKGDKLALPSLVTKLMDGVGLYVGNAVIVGTASSLRNRIHVFESELRAALVYEPYGVLYVSDSDNNCPLELIDPFYAAARGVLDQEASPAKFAVCIIKPDYEAFFLTGLDAILPNASALQEADLPEFRAKQHFRHLYVPGYKESRDQKKFTKSLTPETIRRCRSGVHIDKVAKWLSKDDEPAIYCDVT